MRVYIFVFVASILFDLATTVLGFHVGGLAETNLLYRVVGAWAFLIVYLIDAGIIVVVEWLRKYLPWSPLILLIPTLAYLGAGLTNLQLMRS
jgi:hypothetical protein